MAFTEGSPELEKAKEYTKELTKDPDKPEERNIRLAKISDLIVDDTKLQTMRIPDPFDDTNTKILELKYRKLSFKEEGQIRSQTKGKMKVDPKNPLDTRFAMDEEDTALYGKLLITIQVIEPKITMEDIDTFPDETVAMIVQELQKTKISRFIELKNSQGPVKPE